MIALYCVLLLAMLVGIIGAVVPGIPGTSLILASIVIWGAVRGFADLTVPLVVGIVVFVLSLGIDFLATYWGAKKAGASNWGQIGAFVGFILGFLGFLPTLPIGGPLGPIIGLFFGPLVGAIVGEFLYRKDAMIAIKAGIGIVVGSVVGNLIQGVLALVTVAVFIFNTFPQVQAAVHFAN
ncbi:DUF456 domain-containing protein [Leptolyngbya sp. AN03gr2]|uniref:DUF456 domain-containing protein n=1 Tax=unclassified Leptolyngbya TaxID=2650499 RepID=UPI003D321A8C